MAGRIAQDRFNTDLFPCEVKSGCWSANDLSSSLLQRGNRRGGIRVAFSLLELLVVLSIAALLMGLLMPGFIRIRESARQAACASNLHQIGIALSLYVDEEGDHLPSSYFNGEEDRDGGRKAKPSEMIAAYLGTKIGWDGLGLLYETKFIQSPGVYYCPSHTGSHPFDRYTQDWMNPGSKPIEINYHYRSEINGMVLPRQRFSYFSMREGATPIVTDGLRTKQDFNHIVGANVLRVDSVVQWIDDDRHAIYRSLPDENGQQKDWQNPWSQLTGR